jgi:hypothetical protein
MPASPNVQAEAAGGTDSARYCGDVLARRAIEVLPRVDIACRELIENCSDELVVRRPSAFADHERLAA